MKGYLLKNQEITIGKEIFISSRSSEGNYEVMFEDDGDTGYFYAAESPDSSSEPVILDMLLIYDVEGIGERERQASLQIIWSTDWTKCALVINAYCHAVFDFIVLHGYNRHGFPPANAGTQQQSRKLTDEMVTSFFA